MTCSGPHGIGTPARRGPPAGGPADFRRQFRTRSRRCSQSPVNSPDVGGRESLSYGIHRTRPCIAREAPFFGERLGPDHRIRGCFLYGRSRQAPRTLAARRILHKERGLDLNVRDRRSAGCECGRFVDVLRTDHDQRELCLSLLALVAGNFLRRWSRHFRDRRIVPRSQSTVPAPCGERPVTLACKAAKYLVTGAQYSCSGPTGRRLEALGYGRSRSRVK